MQFRACDVARISKIETKRQYSGITVNILPVIESRSIKVDLVAKQGTTCPIVLETRLKIRLPHETKLDTTTLHQDPIVPPIAVVFLKIRSPQCPEELESLLNLRRVSCLSQ
ncbi:hypothetical protein BGV59_29055 [Burkholderia ubonensis]|nr:hypothetical protein BGV59_29055 [Burkholderia ubonensis]